MTHTIRDWRLITLVNNAKIALEILEIFKFEIDVKLHHVKC